MGGWMEKKVERWINGRVNGWRWMPAYFPFLKDKLNGKEGQVWHSLKQERFSHEIQSINPGAAELSSKPAIFSQHQLYALH